MYEMHEIVVGIDAGWRRNHSSHHTKSLRDATIVSTRLILRFAKEGGDVIFHIHHTSSVSRG